MVSINVSTLLKQISSYLSVLHLSELDISHADGFGDCSMKALVFFLSNSIWIQNTSSSPNMHALSCWIIFPLAYWKQVNVPLLSGVRELINSFMHNGTGMQWRCPNSLLWILCVLLETYLLRINFCNFQFVILITPQETIVPVYKASLPITKYTFHVFNNQTESGCWWWYKLIKPYCFMTSKYFLCSLRPGINYLGIFLFGYLLRVKRIFCGNPRFLSLLVRSWPLSVSTETIELVL